MRRGFLVVDKPSGMTSNQVVGTVREATGIRKAGHAGTLDPMATGVMVVAVGPVTRLLRFVQEMEKEYVATAVFGVATDTLDADGSVVSRQPMEVGAGELEAHVPRFVGTILQVPPMYSALKLGGRRMYALAREGTVVERQARPVIVHELEVLSVGPGPYPDVTFRVVCGKGTYVRSLANDLAAAVGGEAHLSRLRRTRIGPLSEEVALSIDDLASWEDELITPADALSSLPALEVGEETAAAVGHGTPFVGGEMLAVAEGAPFRVIGPDGGMLAVYSRTGDQARPEVVLPG